MKILRALYIEEILRRFNMRESQSQDTLMITRQVSNREKRAKIVDPLKNPFSFLYKETLESLLYAANAT